MARSSIIPKLNSAAVQRTTIPLWHKTEFAVAKPNIDPKDISADRRAGAFQIPGPGSYTGATNGILPN